MKNPYIFLIVAIFFFSSCDDSNLLKSQANNNSNFSNNNIKENEIIDNYNSFLTKIDIPSKLDFCGERIPLEIDEVRERVEREFYMLLQQQGQILLYLKRSGKYFPTFEKILKEENAPDDLKYLSVAESALFMARSGKGAIGLWQFMEETAKSYGLTVNDYVDERRHVVKSTYAGIEYLKRGYIKYKSWISAAAAYNMGFGGFSENLNFQSQDNYFDLFLNEETSRYIFRIVVIKEIMSNPQKYGYNISPELLYKPEKVKIVKETNAIPNLAIWAKSHGTSYKDVKLLNLWILKRELPAPGKDSFYEILIPQ